MNIPIENVYRTSDFPLAVCLAIWQPLIAVDREDPRRAFFVFERLDETEGLVASYHRRQLQVDPREYHSRSKELKSRLYANE